MAVDARPPCSVVDRFYLVFSGGHVWVRLRSFAYLVGCESWHRLREQLQIKPVSCAWPLRSRRIGSCAWVRSKQRGFSVKTWWRVGERASGLVGEWASGLIAYMALIDALLSLHILQKVVETIAMHKRTHRRQAQRLARIFSTCQE